MAKFKPPTPPEYEAWVEPMAWPDDPVPKDSWFRVIEATPGEFKREALSCPSVTEQTVPEFIVIDDHTNTGAPE